MRDFFCTQKDLLLPEEGGREENGSMRYFCYIGYQTKTVDNQTRLVGLCIQKWNLRGEKIAESCLTPRTNPSSFFLSLRKASSEPDAVLLKSQFLRPTVKGRMAFSARLLSMGISPLSRNV